MEKFKVGDKVRVTGFSRFGGSMEVYDFWIYEEPVGSWHEVSPDPGNRKPRELVKLEQIAHYEEPKMTRKQHIENLKREIEALEKLEAEEMDYDPKAWMPKKHENYCMVNINRRTNFAPEVAETHKQEGLGVLFKTRAHAEKYLEDLKNDS